MLLSVKINNCMIYNSEVEFTMRADMRYKRFPNNVIMKGNVNVLKTAVLIGPNNSGKTNFIKILESLKAIMLGKRDGLVPNYFSDNPVAEVSVRFLEGGTENLFEIRFDYTKKEYSYEHFARIEYDEYKNSRIVTLLKRDSDSNEYYAEDEELIPMMEFLARNTIMIYLISNDKFPGLMKIRDKIIAFASKMDIIDMNHIKMKKTIEMLKGSDETHQKVVNFIKNADLYLEDYKYLDDDELDDILEISDNANEKQAEKRSRDARPLPESLHVMSVYKGISLPSVLDSTGTTKMAALASYVIDALENGRILLIDELDSSLHFRLTRAIIALFNNELNETAQLIATTHDISLLDCQTLFRKEQIWFTHKDQDNVYLYSLADFTAEETGVRNTSDLIKKYKEGVFGALPEPDLFQSLLEVNKRG